MNKTPPPISSINLTLALKFRELSKAQFARDMQLSSAQVLDNWFKRGVPYRHMKRAAELLGVSESWLSEGKGEMVPEGQAAPKKPESNAKIAAEQFSFWDRNTPLGEDDALIPFYKETLLSAGVGKEAIQDHNGFKLRFSKATLRRNGIPLEAAIAVTVAGESMEPVLENGDTIGINTQDTTIKDGKVYAINLSGDLRVKILIKLPKGGIRIRSYNKCEYPDEDLLTEEELKELVVLGRVFWSSRLWS